MNGKEDSPKLKRRRVERALEDSAGDTTAARPWSFIFDLTLIQVYRIVLLVLAQERGIAMNLGELRISVRNPSFGYTSDTVKTKVLDCIRRASGVNGRRDDVSITFSPYFVLPAREVSGSVLVFAAKTIAVALGNMCIACSSASIRGSDALVVRADWAVLERIKKSLRRHKLEWGLSILER